MILRRGLGAGKVFFLRENQSRFPGVTVERVFAREYKQGALAAHLFGNVGEVTAEQLELPRYSTLEQGDVVGQSGIEYEYDRFLRGKPGSTRIQVDALGRPKGQLEGKPARAGDNVRLTIDADLQEVGEGALGSFGLPGAFVAMDVRDGEVLAMGSSPTFDPSIFTRPITQQQYEALVSRENDAPLANRAIQGALSDRLGLQADHGDGRARRRRHHAHRDLQRRRRLHDRHPQAAQRGRRRLRADQHERRAQGLLRRLLLFARRQDERQQRPRRGPAGLGLAAWASGSRPASTCPPRWRGWCRLRPGATGSIARS